MATQFSASGGASPAGGGGGQREIRLGVIGAGNIATAILRGLVGQGVVSPSNVWCSSPSGPRRPIADLGVRTTRDNAEVAKNADVLILAVKPYILSSACESLKGALKPATLVVSVSAGISLAQTTAMLGAPPGGVPWRVIRVMPNTPASVGMGASAMCLGPFAGPADSELVSRLFSAVGTVDVVAEAMMDGAWAWPPAVHSFHARKRDARAHTLTQHAHSCAASPPHPRQPSPACRAPGPHTCACSSRRLQTAASRRGSPARLQ